MKKNGLIGGETTMTGPRQEKETIEMLNNNLYPVVERNTTNRIEYLRDRAGKPNNKGRHDIVLYKGKKKVVIEVKYVGPAAGSAEEKIQWLSIEAGMCKKWGDVFISFVSGPGLGHVKEYLNFNKSMAKKLSNNNEYNREIYTATSYNSLLEVLDNIS